MHPAVEKKARLSSAERKLLPWATCFDSCGFRPSPHRTLGHSASLPYVDSMCTNNDANACAQPPAVSERISMSINYHLAKFTASYGTSAQLPDSVRPEVSFVGRSNVGKSSIMNKIFRRKNLVKVSSTRGKTRSINFFECDWVDFVDLPGYGYAKVAKSEKDRWAELMGVYFGDERRFALVVSLIDIRHAASALDEQMIAYLKRFDFPFIVVFTKSDKLGKNAAAKQAAALRKQLDIPADRTVLTSSLKGDGIDALRKMIEEACRIEVEHHGQAS